jgi:hypothetical protein
VDAGRFTRRILPQIAAELSAYFVTSDSREIEKVDENEPIDIFWFR